MSDVAKVPSAMTGTVVSVKMKDTIVVRIDRRVRHKLYDKYMKRSTRLLAHDPKGVASEGDVVVVHSSKPISKRKAWVLHKIVTKNIA